MTELICLADSHEKTLLRIKYTVLCPVSPDFLIHSFIRFSVLIKIKDIYRYLHFCSYLFSRIWSEVIVIWQPCEGTVQQSQSRSLGAHVLRVPEAPRRDSD